MDEYRGSGVPLIWVDEARQRPQQVSLSDMIYGAGQWVRMFEGLTVKAMTSDSVRNFRRLLLSVNRSEE